MSRRAIWGCAAALSLSAGAVLGDVAQFAASKDATLFEACDPACPETGSNGSGVTFAVAMPTLSSASAGSAPVTHTIMSANRQKEIRFVMVSHLTLRPSGRDNRRIWNGVTKTHGNTIARGGA